MNRNVRECFSDFVIRKAIAKVAPLWYSHALFPLTPALSLREREHHRQCIRQPEPLGVVATRSLVLLSLRERAGVRGNGPWKVQTAGVLHLAPKFQNVTAIGQSGNIFLLL